MASSAPRSVVVWLVSIYLLVLAMVVVGGITRLTGSGLSMVEWRPLMGALPPMGEEEWGEVFDKYKESPQYEQVNHWMTVDDFKRIFFWEYLHRLLGRLIGVAFFVPWVFFLARRRIDRPLARRTLVAFVLGGLQGVLGWYMVVSGLADEPSVSHYRLAAHLMLALVVMNWILWILLDLRAAPDRERSGDRGFTRAAWAAVALVAAQIVYGAFMAGTRAGFLYSTFPDMNDRFVPAGMMEVGPAWQNLLENPIAIHFIHRTLGWLLLIAVGAVWWVGRRRARTPEQRRSLALFGWSTVLQMVLGAATVMLYVSTPVAVAHQALGALVLSASIYVVWAFREVR